MSEVGKSFQKLITTVYTGIDRVQTVVTKQNKEIRRLREGFEVMAKLPMSAHPSEVREFSKRMLKGETPYKLGEEE